MVTLNSLPWKLRTVQLHMWCSSSLFLIMHPFPKRAQFQLAEDGWQSSGQQAHGWPPPPESLKWGVCFSRNLGELKKLPVKLLATARYQA